MCRLGGTAAILLAHVRAYREDADAHIGRLVAHAAAEASMGAGWSVRVEEPAKTIERWTVHADGDRIVSSATVESFRAWFEHVAAEHDGEYDGWEASAKP